MQEEIIAGRNSVAEALKNGRTANKLWITKEQQQPWMRALVVRAKELGIPVQQVEGKRLHQLAGEVRHQGVVLSVPPATYMELEDLLAKTAALSEAPLLVLLDGVEDPHNVGAILRSADGAGVHGILLPKRRSSPLTAVVAKTSAGAVEYVPVVRIGNIAQTLEKLKKNGYWVVGTEPQAPQDLYHSNLTGPLVLVVGNEGKGMARLTKELCDFMVSIPMYGQVASLNVSVAASLLMYEVRRQREGSR